MTGPGDAGACDATTRSSNGSASATRCSPGVWVAAGALASLPEPPGLRVSDVPGWSVRGTAHGPSGSLLSVPEGSRAQR